ncbi:response regulator transcription factor [Clostridiaceae bacterium UIB06]|nr:response regulator transcription factor [Clostridiaceae bacterium UIB06]
MKIVIVDSHPVIRKGVISILANEKGIEEIKESSNIQEAMSIITREEIEIVIVDLRLGNEDGLDIVVRAKDINLKTKFIVLTEVMSQEDLKKAEHLGVDGYILKEAFVEDILYAIRVICRGKKYYYPEILKHDNDLDNDVIDQLTDREKDVLKELEKGLSNEEIASRLYISEHTVKKHVSNILNKLNLSNRTQVAFRMKNRCII